MPQTHIVQKGETLSGIAQKYGTTVQELLKANPQITNPNLIYEKANLSIPTSASTLQPSLQTAGEQLKTMQQQLSQMEAGLKDIIAKGKTATLPTIPYDLSKPSDVSLTNIDIDAGATMKSINNWTQLFEKQRQELEETQKQQKGLLEKILAPTKTREEKEAELRAKYEIPEKLDLLQQQNLKLAEIKGELEKLETQRQTEIDNAYAKSATMTGARAEINEINRVYDSKKAYLAAQAGAEAALAQAYAGNLEAAEKLVQNTVDAFIWDKTEQLNKWKVAFDYYGDFIENLREDQKTILNMAYKEAEKKYNEEREDLKYKLELWKDAANKGVYINYLDLSKMTKEEATKWYAERVAPIKTEASVKQYEPPTSYQEWVLAGGERGTGMTYSQWLQRKEAKEEQVAVPTIYGLTKEQTRDVLYSKTAPQWFLQTISQKYQMTPSPKLLEDLWEVHKKQALETHQETKRIIGQSQGSFQELLDELSE